VASLKDAQQAREQSAEFLRTLGAHAISVEEADPDEAGERVKAKGAAPHRARPRRQAYAVVAWFEEEPPPALPDRLEVKSGKRTKDVPLKVRREERFRPEGAAET
jgi:hypothetical protein